MTAGPTGFELASMFYLTKSIVMWRHIAIKCLLNGLALFLVSSGITLFVKFVKDASGGPRKIIVINLNPGNSIPTVDTGHLDQTVHAVLAYIVLFSFVGCACVLYSI